MWHNGLEPMPLCLVDDGELWRARAGIIRALGSGRVITWHDYDTGLRWLDAIENELRARGFQVEAWWSLPKVRHLGHG